MILAIPSNVKNVLNAPNITGGICEKFLVSIGPPGIKTPNNPQDKIKSVGTKYQMYFVIKNILS